MGTAFRADAQAKDTSLPVGGIVYGSVQDSLQGFMLISATLAIYSSGGTLISYQLSNSLGEFRFVNLPVNTRLKLVGSYMGYRSFSSEFVISSEGKELDLGGLKLNRVGKDLKEVVILAVPPVQMNGDTLEFNADAFKLAPDAQAEDLLRALPGVTVWGDGSITVNGRKVSSLLVNGKEFFGKDPRIATQNLPKGIVEKVQVYQHNNGSVLDSLTEVNIKLKKGKDFGYFGRLAAGKGTDDRYDLDGTLNFFSKKIQIGLTGSTNNVNKKAGDMETLMRNSTYKGVGAHLEYQPHFSEEGISRFRSVGASFRYDFNREQRNDRKNQLYTEYFETNNNKELSKAVRTDSKLSGDTVSVLENTDQRTSKEHNRQLFLGYDRVKDHDSYAIEAVLKNSSSVLKEDEYNIARVHPASYNGSTSFSLINGQNVNKSVKLSAKWKHQSRNGFPVYELNYSTTLSKDTSGMYKKLRFKTDEPGEDLALDRNYFHKGHAYMHNLYFTLADLKTVLLGREKWPGISMSIQSNLLLNTKNNEDLVNDRDTVSGLDKINAYLTNSSKFHSTEYTPSILVRQRVTRGLRDRYDAETQYYARLGVQFFNQKHTSRHAFQYLDQSYRTLIPELGASWKKKVMNAYNYKLDAKFFVKPEYPDVLQLVPLTDSSNVYYLIMANPLLKSQDKRELNVKFERESENRSNILRYGVGLSAGFVDNFISDSSVTDNAGRNTYYQVNTDGNRYVKIEGDIQKAFKFTQSQLQASGSLSVGLSRNPNYVNTVLNFSKVTSIFGHVGFYYTLKGWLAAGLTHSTSIFQSRQGGLHGVEFGNTLSETAASASIYFAKFFSVNSNVTRNSLMAGSRSRQEFFIWNASTSCRLFMGSTEVKFSALDMLKQNKGIVSSGSNNRIMVGTTNVLQQYFMLSLIYYPRKFGQ